MRVGRRILSAVSLTLGAIGIAAFAVNVPNEIQLPGTQPLQVSALESPDRCDNCHGGYAQAVEPAFNWRGSMMANATRDPLFWATMAVAEQTFDGAGDLCIRCHSTGGWFAGRSTPTDGSALRASDADGVECDSCHKMTNTNNAEHRGVMNEPFIANDRQSPAAGYYGSGMLSIWSGTEKLGPYASTVARHGYRQSVFHRSKEFCGSCHDVSNSLVGDLAVTNGKQPTGNPVLASGTLGSALPTKAAFRNLPFTYGVVERTFSEHMASGLAALPVSSYPALPADLKAGAIRVAYEAALVANQGGNYEDGSLRTFTCQTCHVPPVTGKGCNKADAPNRKDLPHHDMTGGNAWVPDAILYQNQQGTLRLGGGLTSGQIQAINAGKARALNQLTMAAGLSVQGDVLKVVNLTGHKLISGYPEGRRMWLNVRWYDGAGVLVREDGRYGPIVATVNGVSRVVDSLIDLHDPNTKVYEAHYGITREWAAQLVGFGLSPVVPLAYDRLTGATTLTLGQLASMPAGSSHETFHFVLNDRVMKDNRIPPYGMSYETARVRNALPVPATQYGAPGPAGTYRYWDELTLSPPPTAVTASIRLMYQTTSWEYIQFLAQANDRTNAFLGAEGVNLLDAWLNTGMAAPVTMATTTWTRTGPPPPVRPGAPQNLVATDRKGTVVLTWSPGSPAPTGGYRVYVLKSGSWAWFASVPVGTTTYAHNPLTAKTNFTYAVSAWTDVNGNARFDAGVDLESPLSAKASP